MLIIEQHNVKRNLFFVYGGQPLHPYYEAEPSTVNNKQEFSWSKLVISYKNRGNNWFFFIQNTWISIPTAVKYACKNWNSK